MKRIGNLYQKICSIENLQLADQLARRGKASQPGVIEHDKDRENNISKLHGQLVNKTYKTSAYKVFTIREPKERIISRLPFIDRIVHHAIMIHLEDIIIPTLTADTYSCIKGRGIHAASKALGIAMKDISGTKYCLKLDIRKFYPSLDHSILKQLIRRKIKDNDLLWLLDGIIDSCPVGVPIGNLLSQHFANIYLSPFDHWIKEQKRVKYYFRYSDDMVILSDNKPYLHQIHVEIQSYLKDNLALDLKSTYQVFPIDQEHGRAVDFVGYPRYHTHVLIRKTIKQSFARAVKARKNNASIASYKGWAKHANCKHLLKKLLNEKL